MTNPYYNFDDPAISFSVVDAIRYNVEMEKITTAFDVFPPPVEFSSGSINYGAQPGGQPVNLYSIPVTAIQPGTSYVPGNNIAFKVALTNTGPSQLEVSSNGYRALIMGTAGALVAGDMRVPAIYTPVWDGAQFRTLEMSTRYFGLAEASAPIAVAQSATAVSQANLTLLAKDAAVLSANAALASANAAAASESSAAASRSAASLSASSATASASQALSARQSASTLANQAASDATQSQLAAAAAVAAQDAAIASSNSVTASANAAAASAVDAADAATEAQGIVSAPDFNDRVLQVILETEMVVNSVEMFAANEDPNTIYTGTTWVRLPADVTLTIANATGSNVMTQAGADTAALDTNTMPQHNHGSPAVATSNATLNCTINNGGPGTFDTQLQSVNASLTNAGTLAATIATYSYGALTLQSAGLHSHGVAAKAPSASLIAFAIRTGNGTLTNAPTDSAGLHTHNVTELIHNHSIVMPSHSHPLPALGPHSHSFLDQAHTHQLVLPDHTHTGSLTVDTGGGSGTSFSVVNSNLKLVAWRRTA